LIGDIAERRWFSSLDAVTLRAVRRAIVALASVPLLVILASRIPDLPRRGVLGAYGVVVVLSTLVLFYQRRGDST
jgi:hypothetical protein